MKDLKQRVEGILNKAKEVKQYSLASEIDSDCIEWLEMTDIIKALTEREAKLVDVLKDAEYLIWHVIKNHGTPASKEDAKLAHTKIKATLKELGAI